MKNYGMFARVLIALLFVVAGFQKLMDFGGTVTMMGNLGLPMPTLVAVLVIFIEIVVALAFAYGYKLRESGYILIGFVALTILVVHNDMSQLGAALKNLAVIGGIMLAICCKDKHHG
ncbi:MAG: DoxX family protein [Candidatus Paceibacterota bacterium]